MFVAKANLDRLTREIEALVKEQTIPVGLGALTVSLIEGEVCDWQRFNLSCQAIQVRLGRADLLHDRLKLSTHKRPALRRQPLPLARTGPARFQALVFMLDAQRSPVIFQPAHLAFPKLPLPPDLPALLLHSRRNPNRSELIPLPIHVT